MTPEQHRKDLAQLRELLESTKQLLQDRHIELAELFTETLRNELPTLDVFDPETRDIIVLCIIFTALSRTYCDSKLLLELKESAYLN